MPFMQPDFDLKFALADIILVYADFEKLKGWLSPGVEITESGLQRRISYQGKQLIQIQYSEAEKFVAQVTYEHLLRGYKIQIHPISRSTP